jgi:hypothetical protein
MYVYLEEKNVPVVIRLSLWNVRIEIPMACCTPTQICVSCTNKKNQYFFPNGSEKNSKLSIH